LQDTQRMPRRPAAADLQRAASRLQNEWRQHQRS
jgi:hypothetical protein